jgi:hypothetical protein
MNFERHLATQPFIAILQIFCHLFIVLSFFSIPENPLTKPLRLHPPQDTTGGLLPEQVLLGNEKVRIFFKTKYSRRLLVQAVKTSWHGATIRLDYNA